MWNYKGCTMWRKTQCCLTFALLLMVVLADHHGSHDHGEHSSDHHHLHHGKDDAHPDHSGKDKCYTVPFYNNNFAFTLYKKLHSEADAQGKNTFFSPLSISMALSMLALGAKGETHSQIFNTLGYGCLTEHQVNEAYEHILTLLTQSQESRKLDAGSGLAVREGFKPIDKFLKDLQHFYHGETFTVDFSKPEVAVKEVNKFIAKKTKDTITDMLKTLDADAVMVLLNYIYFRGEWENPFEVEHTHKADFHVDENTTVSVDMMRRTGLYEYFGDRNDLYSAIIVPYKGNASMILLRPKEGKMVEVEEQLANEGIKAWRSKAAKRIVDLFLPKFSISASSCLADILKELGMADAFSDKADFSGMSKETKLKASKVLHQAVIKVDEKGTEASAATTIEIVPMSVPESMNLNIPFLVLIVESTGNILFMGKINNPTEQ